jgi:type III secretion protein J
MGNILDCKIKKYTLILQKIAMALLLTLLCACDESILYKNIEENEANLMTSVLLREGIDTKRMANTDGTYNIVISDASYFPEAIDALSLRGFPRAKFESLCTIFKGDSMVSTPIEQKARYTCAKAQELSGSLTELDGISMARVHLVLSETDPITRKLKPASASIMIKYKLGMDVDTIIPKIKQLVSYAVEDLPYQNVSVMLSEEVGRKEDKVAKAFAEKQSTKTQTHNTAESFIDEDDENTGENQNNSILYIIMAIMTFGMIILVFFIIRMKTSQSQPTNLPNIRRSQTEF